MSDAPASNPPSNGRGGARPGAGRKPKPHILSPSLASNHPQSPLEFLLAVVNDPSQPPGRRIRCAIAAAPYVHARVEPLRLGKKELAAELARTAGRGEWEG